MMVGAGKRGELKITRQQKHLYDHLYEHDFDENYRTNNTTHISTPLLSKNKVQGVCTKVIFCSKLFQSFL